MDSSGNLVLILGGVRSGKSRFGQELAGELGGDEVVFVATAEARDDEMSRRIDQHRRSRPTRWRTLEQPLDVANAIEPLAAERASRVILLDCLTLLVSNVVLQDHTDPFAAEQRMRTELEALVRMVRQRETTLIVVSGEVGMGLVPETAIGRLFRDLLGWSNQYLAAHAAATYFMVAGLPINMSPLATTAGRAARALKRPQPISEVPS